MSTSESMLIRQNWEGPLEKPDTSEAPETSEEKGCYALCAFTVGFLESL